MPHTARAHFSAAMEEVPPMLLWVRNHLIQTKMDPRSSKRVELAAEEAIVNVIRYAYRDQKGDIELRFNVLPEGIELTILDRGPPFNPLTDVPKSEQSPSEERKEGGFGIFLMRKCVDHVRYQREKETNVLTLIKRFSQKK